MRRFLMSAAAIGVLVVASDAVARDQIRIVGSSTMFPFSTTVAEQFGNTSDFRTPVVESTGSGGGFKLFCAGVGEQHPDITNASRAIKESEIGTCAANGITEITEVKVGYDGIVLANAKGGAPIDVSRDQLWLALAAEVPVDGALAPNPYVNWSDVDPALPNVEIEVLGPPPTSGTRDAFVELVMDVGCERPIEGLGLDEDAAETACAAMREDGAFIEAGENDNLIVQKLQANPNGYGIFGFSFLDQNMDKMQGSLIDGVEPTFENIADGSYPVSRSLFFYVKNAHVGVIPGIEEFIAEFTGDRANGEEGYLADKGLIPLLDEDRDAVRTSAANLTPLQPDKR